MLEMYALLIEYRIVLFLEDAISDMCHLFDILKEINFLLDLLSRSVHWGKSNRFCFTFS